MLPKSHIARIENKELLKTYHDKACIACGYNQSDPAHIKTKGSGGDDLAWNIIPLCRNHHQMQHKIGWIKFMDKYWNVAMTLKVMGWVVYTDKFGSKLRNKVHK